MDNSKERGSAVVLVMVLVLLVGMIGAGYLQYAASEVRFARDHNHFKRAMGVAEAGMDKAILELRNAVFEHGAPTLDDLGHIAAPTIAGFQFVTPGGAPAYNILPDGDYHRNEEITEGRWRGMFGDYQRYEIRVGVTGRNSAGGVVLTQAMQVLAIPVFQFGVFYQDDLEIQPGPRMFFDGPVHTNASLYLGSGNTLEFNDRLTAVGQAYRWRKDDRSYGAGSVQVKDQAGVLKSMEKTGGGYYQHNDTDWAVTSLTRWGGNLVDSAHDTPPMNLPIPRTNTPHDIIVRADSEADPQLERNKFENKADIVIWRDDQGDYQATLGEDDFPLEYNKPQAISGRININPNNSSSNEFVLVKTDGSQITRDDLQATMPDWQGAATLIHVKPKGSGNQNTFVVDGQAISFKNSETYDIIAEQPMTVRLYNDRRNSSGRATGKWFVEPVGTTVDVQENGRSFGYRSVAAEATFGDWREGDGSAMAMRALDIDVKALGQHPDYPEDGALVYVYSDYAGNNERPVVRLVNGEQLPDGGLSVASVNPVYLKGNFNTENGTKPSMIAGDAVTILSNAWTDENSWRTMNNRTATNTEVNTVVMTGNTSTTLGGGRNTYNGGLENVLRFCENWTGRTLRFRGSIVCMWNSQIANGRWVYGNNRYEAPTRDWGYDEMYRNPRNAPPGIPNVIALEALEWRQDRWTEAEMTEAAMIE